MNSSSRVVVVVPVVLGKLQYDMSDITFDGSRMPHHTQTQTYNSTCIYVYMCVVSTSFIEIQV